MLLRVQRQGENRPEMKTQTVITEKDLPGDVLRAIEQGRKVEAIKLLREATGLGLANAKVLVDKAARQQGITSKPPAFVEEESNVGKLLRALLLVVAVYAFYHYYTGA